MKHEFAIEQTENEPVDWQYTTETPADGWMKRDFDASQWKTGPAGFGTTGTPGAVVRTEWKTPEIWLRREFDAPGSIGDHVLIARLHHDKDAEIFLNGVPAGKAERFTTRYGLLPLSAEAAAAVVPGKNVLAVRCRPTNGGQYIDVGLIELDESNLFDPR